MAWHVDRSRRRLSAIGFCWIFHTGGCWCLYFEWGHSGSCLIKIVYDIGTHHEHPLRKHFRYLFISLFQYLLNSSSGVNNNENVRRYVNVSDVNVQIWNSNSKNTVFKIVERFPFAHQCEGIRALGDIWISNLHRKITNSLALISGYIPGATKFSEWEWNFASNISIDCFAVAGIWSKSVELFLPNRWQLYPLEGPTYFHKLK